MTQHGEVISLTTNETELVKLKLFSWGKVENQVKANITLSDVIKSIFLGGEANRLNRNMKKILIVLFVFLTSCSSSKITFIPEWEELLNAKVGVFYQQDIILAFQGSGEVISLSSSNFKTKITPEHSGLRIEPDFSGCGNNDSAKCNDYSKAVIKGVPGTKGIITVEIVAKTYASMYSKSKAFVKKYQIIVD